MLLRTFFKFRGIICTFYAIFNILGPKSEKVSLNICRPHAGRKISAPQHKQPESLRVACGESPQLKPCCFIMSVNLTSSRPLPCVGQKHIVCWYQFTHLVIVVELLYSSSHVTWGSDNKLRREFSLSSFAPVEYILPLHILAVIRYLWCMKLCFWQKES